MARRKADARDIFELLESCRFGGDLERLAAILDQCRFDLADSKAALLTLQAGRSPSVRAEVTDACAKLLKRRVAAATRSSNSRNDSGETASE
ncbi:hypothetical protein GC170_08930 [bacterium]|nr:hypothetical protein [bacterium]